MDVKNIIIVGTSTWSIYNYRLGLMEVLKDRGYNVSFAGLYDEYVDKLVSRGFKYHQIFIDKKINPIKDLNLILSLYKIYKLNKISLALHYTIKPNIYGSIICKMLNIKCINTITGMGYVFIKKTLLTKFVKLLYRFSLNSANKVIFQNNDDKKFFIENKFVLNEKAVLIRGSGVDIDYFNPNFCDNIKRDNNNFIFLFMSRMLWDKGVKELVRAFKMVRDKYPNAELWFIGPTNKGNPSDIPVNQIEDWVKEGILKYFGMQEDVRPFICKADAVVLPSYREGLPKPLLESSAMEKPIITTDTIGCKDVVEDGKNGYLVEVKNWESLMDAMFKMIELDDIKRHEMGKHGRNMVKANFTNATVINSYIDLVDNCKKG